MGSDKQRLAEQLRQALHVVTDGGSLWKTDRENPEADPVHFPNGWLAEQLAERLAASEPKLSEGEEEHAPEPWHSLPVPLRDNVGYRHWIFGKSGGWSLASVANGPEADANARRIVACVNAMAGIPDPEALRRERDEAVRLLGGFSREQSVCYGDATKTHLRMLELADEVRAFLARIKEAP